MEEGTSLPDPWSRSDLCQTPRQFNQGSGNRTTAIARCESQSERHMRTTDWHDPPRMFGLAHPDLRDPFANDFEVVAWPLQSRPPTHVFGSWGT
jgi:hypothetical protein